MTKICVLIIVTMSCSIIHAQVNVEHRMFTAVGLINGIQAAAVKSGSIEPDHVIIIDGIIILNQLKLSAVLEGVYANSIMNCTVLDKTITTQQFDDKKARNGAILVVLDNKAYRQFSKNIRKFEKWQSAKIGSNGTVNLPNVWR